jgi:DsbC/DsbD-like thiol-disulfide interchange protein
VARIFGPIKTAALATVFLRAFTELAMAQIASPWNEHPNSRVRLIAGEGRVLGIELQLSAGWKTYWRMPGDAGVPPSFDWVGTKNVAAFDVLYPAPVSMPDQGGVAVGYKGTVVFPVQLKLVDETAPTRITLEFAFGVCKDICIPVESRISLDLPGSAQPWPSAQSIKAHLQRVPRVTADASQSSPALTSVTSALNGAKPHITLQTRGAIEAYIEAPDGLFVPMAQKTAGAGGLATFVVDLTKSPDVKDLVGKPLRVTLTTPDGGVETTIIAK